MLELIVATTIISIALVPALKLTRSSVLNIEVLERSELTVSLATSKLEEELARTAANWDLSARSGNFAAIGRPELLFQSKKSDMIDDGGVPGSLAVIDVIVWHDVNGSGGFDSNEPQTRLMTKIAKVVSYEYSIKSP